MHGSILIEIIAFVEVRPLSKARIEITWKQFDERTNSLANTLLGRGVKKGDRVFLMGRNSISWLEAYFYRKDRRVGEPPQFPLYRRDIAYCAAAAQPSASSSTRNMHLWCSPCRAGLPSVKPLHQHGEGSTCATWRQGRVDRRNRPPRPHQAVELRDEDECGLYFTSGTTGAPKPILLLHKNLFCTAINEVTNLLLTKEDALLMIPPMYHVAMGHLLGSMLIAAKTVLLTEAITPKAIFESMDTERVRVAFLLVPWVLDILEALDKGELKKGDYDLKGWRILQMGAQPIPTSLVRRWKEHFPRMECHNTYGLSETMGPGTIHNRLDDESKIGAIGKPGLLWDARIVNGQGEDVPQGEVGDIIVKGMGVMKEYYKNPELTARTIVDGWLHTGDLGRIDKDGFIFLVDRQKDLVISGGENVYPVEVEEVIQKHPKVRDVAVIGTAHERLGEVVTAIIDPVAEETLTQEEMALFCEQNLPRYKRPRRIIFGSVPRSSTGKIEKPKLRERYK